MSAIMHIDLEPCIDHGRTRSLKPEGYALVGWPGRASRCTALHRLVYAQHNGVTLESLTGRVIRHTCDNTRCINPKHLVVGSPADNNKDRASRGRSAKSIPSRQRLSTKDCNDICRRHTLRCSVNGTVALAREYGVDSAVIGRVLSGRYPNCQP